MKSNILFLFIFLLPLSILAQPYFINKGGDVKVLNGTDVKVKQGYVTNKNSGSIVNDGDIYLGQTFHQETAASYTGGTSSWVWFEGTGVQYITGDAKIDMHRLKVDNGQKVVLSTDVEAAYTVDLNLNGDIEIGNNNLIVTSGGIITNYDQYNFIITNGTGRVQQEVGGASVFYPVGNSSYNPAILTNTGTIDNFLIRVEDAAYNSYPVGSRATEDIVDRTWWIGEAVSGGSNIQMTLQWATDQEVPTFDRNNAGISHWKGSSWDKVSSWGPSSFLSGKFYNITRGGIRSFSPFVIEDISNTLPIEMLDFNGKRLNAESVVLTWRVIEDNNRGFFLERMLEGKQEFEKVAFIPSIGQYGVENNYEFIDFNPHSATSYYRLRQVDWDGQESHSKMVRIEGRTSSSLEAKLYPNPTKDELWLDFAIANQKGLIRLIDVRGIELNSFIFNTASNLLVPIEGVHKLSSGTYFLVINFEDGRREYQKFIKQ